MDIQSTATITYIKFIWLLKSEMVLTYKNLPKMEFYPNLIFKYCLSIAKWHLL